MPVWLKWLWLRVPLWLALVVAVATWFVVKIATDPKLPLIDTWIDASGSRIVARVLLVLLALGVVLLAAGIAWGYLLHGTPSALKGPLGIEMNWTPTEAGEVKGMMEAQQATITETAKLLQETIDRVDRLASKKPQSR